MSAIFIGARPETLMGGDYVSCEVLSVSVSGYLEHQRRQRRRRPSLPGVGRLSDEALLAHMRAIHAEVRQEYGWPRMAKELCALHQDGPLWVGSTSSCEQIAVVQAPSPAGAGV